MSRALRLTTPLKRLTQVTSHTYRFYPRTIRTMAPIPATMKGVVIEKTGGVEVLEYRTNVPVPGDLKEGEVLIKNAFIGINYIDTYFRSGLYPSAKPEILGREAEGEVVAVGGGQTYGIKVGDRVVFLGTGSYAEYTKVQSLQVHVVPAELKPGDGAAALLQGLTALTLIRESHVVQPGEWALVHAAAGGVGLWLVQLLKSTGAKVIGTASNAEKIALAKENGADYMIDYSKEDLISRVKEITSSEGVAVVFDGVGKSTFDSDFEVVARKGTIASFGNASGAVPPLTIQRLSGKNVKLLRPTLFNYITTREEFEKYTKELFDFIIKDKLNVRVHEVYPLQEVQRAQLDLEGRKTTGKLLLKP